MIDIIKRNKIASALIFIILFGLFIAPSECDGVRGWGTCVGINGKVYHLSPLNFILPPPPDKMITRVERGDKNHGITYSSESGFSINY